MKIARKEKEVEQVRQKILDAALDIIVKEGFDALTMRKLGSRIGMTAPNIYNYYSGKDALYISIVIKGFEMLHQALESAFHQTDDKLKRARALINAYVTFGMEKPSYYDIMFTRPTPKYNDYLGTPHEKLSAVELKISMEIADLAMRATTDILGKEADPEIVQMRVIQIWSLLHGMVSLNNSKVVSYVAENPAHVYAKILDEFIEIMTFFSIDR